MVSKELKDQLDKTDKLVDKALENGGLDNISLILIKYDGKVGVEDDK